MCDRQKTIDLKIELPERDVLRMMGCGKDGSVRPQVRDVITRVVSESMHLVQARGTYVVHPVTRMTDNELELNGCPVIQGPIAAFLRPATRVAAFVVTIGPDLERLSTRRMEEGDMLGGYTLNALGSAAADAAADAMSEHIYWNHASDSEGITPPFSPGYCGMPLEQQKTLFSIVDGGLVGVELLSTMIMEPMKSISALVGLGPKEQVAEHGVPCQWCDLETCKMRR